MTDLADSAETNPVWAVRDSRHQGLTATHKSILYALASRMSAQSKWAFPNLERLAGDAGCSVSTAKLALAELVSWGLVTRDVRKTTTGRLNHYALNIDALATGSAPAPEAEARARARQRLDARLGARNGSAESRPMGQPESSPPMSRNPADGSAESRPICPPHEPESGRWVSRISADGSAGIQPTHEPESGSEEKEEEKREDPKGRETSRAPAAARAHAHARADVAKPAPDGHVGAAGVGQLSLLTSAPEPAPEPVKRNGSKNDYAYIDAFDAGQRDASDGSFETPRNYPNKMALVYAVRGHANGKTGNDVLEWIRATSSRYRRAKPDDARFGGFKPQKMLDWLNGGAEDHSRFKPARLITQPRRDTYEVKEGVIDD